MTTSMQTVSLDGQWTLRKTGSGDDIPAQVPGCVHADLLRAGLIEDPYYRENELDVQWIGETDWTYSREFEAGVDLLSRDRVLLRCEGLDTFSTLSINGREIGRTDNMHRTWEFDVRDDLHEGTNTIEVKFESVLPYMKKMQAARELHAACCKPWEPKGRSYVRKEHCNLGWDWGPVLITCGIWRSISLVAFDTARVADVYITQKHGRGKVVLGVAVEAEQTGRAPLQARVRVEMDGEVVAEGCEALARRKASVALKVSEPKLWWPNGMGEQPLYDAIVELLDADGNVLDCWRRRIGLRTLELRRRKDKWGESFEFVANGVPSFAKGANWIPADAILANVSDEGMCTRLLQAAADAHMNMIRVWGGGLYESDLFYDLCDELGICVWQDFAYACASYPADDPTFMDNVKAESEDNVRRIRHHASLALWCGNNELEMWIASDTSWPRMPWKEYKELFDKLIPGVTKKLDPQTPYWPCSPHTPVGDRNDHNNPDVGDAHLWAVWHGRQPFEWYRTSFHRFCSEFGFQSFPEPRSVEAFTAPEDRNLTSPVMEHHQRSGTGNAVIMHYMLSWFRMPLGFENMVWLSQIQQGMAIKYAVEHWRRNTPRCMGALYWQLNDCWPVASWASIDYYGRWKALHCMARRFFAPVMVSGVEDGEKGTVEVHVSSDLPETFEGEVRWQATDLSGKALDGGTVPVKVGRRSSKRVSTLKLKGLLAEPGPRDLLVWLDLVQDGEVLSQNIVTFGPPKTLELLDAGLSAKVRKAGKGEFTVTLSSEHPALWAWIDVDGAEATCPDNFVCVRPGRPVELLLRVEGKMTVSELRKRLRSRSLVDTY